MFENILLIEKPSPGLVPLKSYFKIFTIFKALIIALLLSLFIYLDYFGFTNPLLVKIVTSFSAFAGFYLLLKSSKKVFFWSGFFIGLLWFYWIGFSFRYYEIAYAIPLMVLLVSLVYGLLFWIVGLFRHPLLRAVLFLLFSYIHPLSFNWFVPELTLIHSFFGIQKYQFGLFLAAIVLFIVLDKKYKPLAILALLGATPWNEPTLSPAPLKVMLADSQVPQEIKWDEAYRQKSIENNIATILEATAEGYDMVVLNESAFALYLNAEMDLMKRLQELAKEIVIVTGALYWDEGRAFNSTYYFTKDRIYIAHKVVLVPFGEEIPLPKFLARWINDIFYDGAEDYHTAKKPTDIMIKGEKFRNAICYEATRDELFVDNPKYMIAISNNAWFTPSIEPTLQKLLMEYYAKKYHTVIYHSANMGICKIIY